MTGLEARGDAIAAQAVAAATERLADAAEAALPGLAVTAESDRVVIRGRGLARRLLADPALRWLGGLIR
ncbi:hypothetical protein AB2M62_18525 [Sphingomonas sp. MMS12-HWE2-04]|uniref:hypothetical protein n=1 Tax=Sphingomonas sp. MMS12-HWE2-04 TaxID=3234199 RepID=UPI00384C18E3